MEHSTQYVVKREPGRCVFVPTPLFGSLMAGGFGAGSALLIYLSTVFFRRKNTVVLGAIFLLVAVYSAGLGIRAWRTRRAPLRIERGGRVTYGKRELCVAGTVRAVRITPSRSGEAKLYEVCFEQNGGKLVSIPSQYFAAFHTAAQARPFAAELADALGIPVTE
jgi:hypothetical protein